MGQLPARLCWLLLAGSVFTGGKLLPAQSGPRPETATTIKATARIVLLDAVVADKSGTPIRGLKPSDFTVLEDGKIQHVQVFEERSLDQQASQSIPDLKLPPNTYTNYIASRNAGAINILLFDRLNTERLSLVRARQELLQYLGKLGDHSRVLLFILGSDLHLVHGLTDDPQELIQAARELSTNPHSSYSDALGVSEELVQARMAGVTRNPAMYRKLTEFLWGEQEGKDESRAFVTLQALNQLARSVAIFPGRKNLIWISGGFPFDPASTDSQMRRTATLLAATQIAVYPIDVRGVAYLGAMGQSMSPDVFAPYGGTYEDTSGQAQELNDIHVTMTNLAMLTGGHAVFGRNDLAGAIQESTDSGSQYYTLGYRPANGNWNGSFRKVKVRVSLPNTHVLCRPGYFAVPDPLGSPEINRTFTETMQPTAPLSTTLIIKVRVVPPKETGKPVDIDYLVDVHDVSLPEAPDHGRKSNLWFVAAAWEKTGKPEGSVTSEFAATLTPSQLELLRRTGLQVHQQFLLKPGAHQLRLGVVDRLSGKIGTIDVPLKIPPATATP